MLKTQYHHFARPYLGILFRTGKQKTVNRAENIHRSSSFSAGQLPHPA